MQIAPHVDLPDAALTQHLAIIGATGSGKTYTAKGPVEKLLNSTQQRILEAIGSWWVMGIKPTRAMVALLAGIDPNGGHFSNSIGPLSTLGLITRKNGIVTPTPLLFPEALT